MQPYDRIRYYRLSESEKATLVAKLQALLATEKQVKQAWLFGSFTRKGSFRDIDIAIQTEPELEFQKYLQFNADIELKLGLPVDLVEIAKVSTTLKDKILKSGVQIKVQ
jgi:uncharacterized protein